MKHFFIITVFAAMLSAVPVSANSRIKIDTVPSEYAPINSPTNREPVSLSSYHFEVEPETGRARVVVEYTYPDQMTFGPDDDAGGPASTIVQLPGLRYDAGAHAIVYDSKGTKSLCAIVADRSGLFGHHLKVKNTGSCTVSVVAASHTEDTGWNLRRFRALDTYLEFR
jgi:hypothetical protein